ncbi:hypothetical protein ACIQ6Y_23390 [Streptomyces sp. NPDC096205]|uniref:hypothetical protein n=1 Tax=Streptomyces sp. NPDC096205 TaxID=3366081 RepID=UPI00382A32CD
MIRGNIRHRPVRSDKAASDLHTAAAVGAAQIPAMLVIWFFTATDDQYGGGGSALGLACAMVLTPLWLPPVGMVHALVQSLPATLLTGLIRRRARGPEWGWQVLCALLVGVLWAVPPALLWGWPFATTAVVFAALGVLPALALAYARVRARTGRAWGTWGTWWRSGVVGLGLLVLSVPGCALAAAIGLIEVYEPPQLSQKQLVGVWRGEKGAELRLRPDGRADLVRLPAQPEFDASADFSVCDGTGTWELDTEGRHDTYGGEAPNARDGVVVRLDGGCGQETYWTIAGTERRPELFVVFGDPDSGELRVLERRE